MVLLWLVKPSLFKSLTVSWATLIQSLLFVPHFSASFPDKVWPLLVPGWSLNYELFFYCLFGFVIALPRRLWVVSTSVILLTLASLGYVIGPFEDALKRVYTSPLLLEFLVGVWVGSLWLKKRLSCPLWLSIALILVGTILLIGQELWSVGPLATGIGAACVVVGVLAPQIAALQCRSLRVLGDSSYSLYLTHIFTLGVLRYFWIQIVPSDFGPEIGVIFMAVALCVCVVVGVAVFRFLELPVTRFSFGQHRRQ
jgi:exopolysaccharide production protein ExoZ